MKEYGPEWLRQFESIQTLLLDILEARAFRFDYISSASIPGLGAKNAIDIQLTVEKLDTPIIRKLVNASHEHRGSITHDHIPSGWEPEKARMENVGEVNG